MAKHSNHKDHLEYKNLYKHLRHTGRRQKRNNIKDRRGTIAGRIGIDERPKVE
jgi:IS30 family transposase